MLDNFSFIVFTIVSFSAIQSTILLVNGESDNFTIIWFPEYISPFEEANDTYNDFESQVLYLYRTYCRKDCSGQIEERPNKLCDRCYCDKACHYYGDCCPDIMTDQAKVVPSNCSSVYVPQSGSPIKMVHSCPKSNAKTELEDLCLNQDTSNFRFSQPVSDTTTGLTYRNRYCAQCHGRDNNTEWSTSVSCRGRWPQFSNPYLIDSVYQDIIAKDGCYFGFSPPSEIVGHYCSASYDIISSCNQTGYWWNFDALVKKACDTLPSAQVNSYKNLFCYICNTGKSWEQIKADYIKYDPLPFKVDLASLFDLTENEPDVDVVTREACVNSTIEDPYQCTCRNVSCINSKKYEDGECKSVFKFSYYNTYSFTVAVEIVFNSTLISSNDTLIVKDILAQGINKLDGYISTSSISVGYISPCMESMTLRYFIELNVYFKKPFDALLFEKGLLSAVPLLGISYRYNTVGMHLRFDFTTPPDSDKKYIINSDLTIPCKDYHTPRKYEKLYPFEDESIIYRSQNMYFDKIYSCPSVLLSDQEVIADLYNRNPTLFLRRNRATLGRFRFRQVYEGYMVCVDDYVNPSVDDDVEDQRCGVNEASQVGLNTEISPLGILSGICTSCSLFFLFITFIVFCLLQKLRTSIGMSIMALTVTLFLAQALFEFGAEQIEISWLCQMLGILTHFFWLSAIFWMNVCTAILFYKLCYPMESRLTSTYKMMLYSLVYTCVCPVVIVTIVIISSYYISGKLGYGGRSCYITTATSRLYAFALPVALLITINVSLFCYTFIKLKKHQQQLQSNQDNEISMWACLKLSVITGLTWIFAYIYEATRYEIFSYLFTVFVGCQGCIIFLVFVCSRRVWNQLKVFCKKGDKVRYIEDQSKRGDTSSKSDRKGNSSEIKTIDMETDKTDITTVHAEKQESCPKATEQENRDQILDIYFEGNEHAQP